MWEIYSKLTIKTPEGFSTHTFSLNKPGHLNKPGIINLVHTQNFSKN